MTIKKQVCNRCVMDTTDPNILFDNEGICNHCKNFDKNIFPYHQKLLKNKIKFIEQINKLKEANKKNEFDCIIGLSGGVDSSYMLHLAVKELGLRPLVFHVDAGWNSNTAVINIENVIDKLNLTLQTNVVYWPEMRDLQLSFFKAQVPHLDTPQDHAFFASTYNYSAEYGIKAILNGGNYATECVREPLDWHYHASDLLHLKTIQKKFGSINLKKFPMCDIFKYKIYYKFLKQVNVIQPLNYFEYNKQKAMDLLTNEYNWKPYSHKHYESRFTKFYEGYWLLQKFGYDKRKAHFSSLILNKQMTRDDALDKISKSPLTDDEIKQEKIFLANKLNISANQLEGFFNGENKSFRDYKSNYFLIDFFTNILRFLKIEKRVMQ